MNILHINSTWEYSGAEKIYRSIYNELWWKKISMDEYLSKNNIVRYLNKLFFSFSLYFHTKKIIKEFSPDVILLHWIDFSPFTILLAIKNHPNVVQIVHDITQAWCPSGRGIYRDTHWSCNLEMKFWKCSKHCGFDKWKLKFSIYYFRLNFFLTFKKKCIRKYISPSVALKRILLKNNFSPVISLWNVIDIKDNKNDPKMENIIVYVGALEERKWIDKLLSKIDISSFKWNWKFYILGDWNLRNKLQKKYTGVEYHFFWKVSNETVMSILQKAKILLVPSLLFENYPTVALEWIMSNTVVLWTDSGWIKEIIWSKNIFNIHNSDWINTLINNVIDNYTEFYDNMIKEKNRLLEQRDMYFWQLKIELLK